MWGRPRVVIGRSDVPARSGGPPLAAAGLAVLAAGGLAISGCGGGSRADAHEKGATYDLAIVRASFPKAQAVARPATLELRVRNTGTHTVPDIAVTLDSLNYRSTFAGLADPSRPVWAIERGPGRVAQPPVESQNVSIPGSGHTNYVNTWALGPLAPGHTQTFAWQVVPVKAGRHTVHFAVAAGLAGKAKARLSSGAGSERGELSVNVAPAPPITHVDPKTGKIVSGTFNGMR